MASSSTPSSAPPRWLYCDYANEAGEPVGCRGSAVAPYGRCLQHLDGADRSAYLASLSPGSDIDHRGTTFSPALLKELLAALRDPATGQLRIGDAWFAMASFTGEAWFVDATFTGRALFSMARFEDRAAFHGVTFTGKAAFDRVAFAGVASFHGARFIADALFSATFVGKAWFGRATFHRGVDFRGSVFEEATELGPLVCAGSVNLSATVFRSPVTAELAAHRVLCMRTRWAATATLRLRYATVDLTDAVFDYPLKIASARTAFGRSSGSIVYEARLMGLDPRVRVASVSGTDAAHLELSDVDLSGCKFTGTFNLDQLQMDGDCSFASAPGGIWRLGARLTRWTPRQALAEEHHWRADRGQVGWTALSSGSERQGVGPADLTRVYRQLRKSLEDGKNEPDAADFYYGEMEMRRLDPARPRGERHLLAAYWALSGYGLRASRALGWLLAAITATVLLMMLWGLPKDDPTPQSTGTLAGQHLTLRTDTPAPVNPGGPLTGRLTSQRFEKSLRVVINSVVFRSSGQNLTTVGTYTEMVARICEPALLGLAVLAVRGRVKR
ncbi:pentapeptide repeat-containing protein [Streptomyces sp. SDr-06]|uniref:pentapeptide repeat-containing protein n=1 Tax=Streptomyces sp. SDr-06 TaxID=2267702 RepID=UPI000DEBDBB9|nr:pentapeptide repeat-containing protein [Streptomyces sp. SDr-06]RCH65460.1 pentapeptide repeat-containing protein [Streptomyces sp. SDr-06]